MITSTQPIPNATDAATPATCRIGPVSVNREVGINGRKLLEVDRFDLDLSPHQTHVDVGTQFAHMLHDLRFDLLR